MSNKLSPWINKLYSRALVPRVVATSAKSIFIIIAMQVVVGFSFKLAGFYLSIDRPIFNVSYFLLPFIFFAPAFFRYFVALLLVICDVVFSVSLNGLSGSALLGLLKYVPLSGSYGYTMLVVVIVSVVILSVIVFHTYNKTNLFSYSISLVFVVLFSSLMNFSTGSPFLTLGMPGMLVKHYLGFKTDELQFHRLFSFNADFVAIDGGSFLMKNVSPVDDKVISVVVESLGLPLDDSVRSYFEKKFATSLSSRKITFSKSHFHGTTINGEVRELCGYSTSNLVVTKIPDHVKCLPNQLKLRGVNTFAYHNNNGMFYDRIIWYPEVGFDMFYDGDKLKVDGYKEPSRVFNGVSDHSVGLAIEKKANGSDKFFIHWMTMDSHSPYSQIIPSSLERSNFNCDYFYNINDVECKYLKNMDLVLDGIIGLVSRLPDVKFVISGDHAPNFQDAVNPYVVENAKNHYDQQYVMSMVIQKR